MCGPAYATPWPRPRRYESSAGKRRLRPRLVSSPSLIRFGSSHHLLFFSLLFSSSSLSSSSLLRLSFVYPSLIFVTTVFYPLSFVLGSAGHCFVFLYSLVVVTVHLFLTNFTHHCPLAILHHSLRLRDQRSTLFQHDLLLPIGTIFPLVLPPSFSSTSLLHLLWCLSPPPPTDKHNYKRIIITNANKKHNNTRSARINGNVGFTRKNTLPFTSISD
jgi:hypothetical protein